MTLQDLKRDYLRPQVASVLSKKTNSLKGAYFTFYERANRGGRFGGLPLPSRGIDAADCGLRAGE